MSECILLSIEFGRCALSKSGAFNLVLPIHDCAMSCAGWGCMLIWVLIATFIDSPMFNVNCLAMHKMQMHAGAISKLLYGFESVRKVVTH